MLTIPRVRQRPGCSGNAMVEFTLVGIPLIFILISTFEMGRGMWLYHTLAYAAKEGTRFAIVKGDDCSTGSNSCAVKVEQVAKKIQYAAMGLDPSLMQVRFISLTQTVGYESLQTALSDQTKWPSLGTTDFGGNQGQDLEIDVTYPFTSAITFFWPGAGHGQQFGTFTFAAVSKEEIQF